MNDNTDSRFLVLLETSGNQNYIFATNKLKENIGASELTYSAGTKWVLEVVHWLNHSSCLRGGDRIREYLLNPELNPPIESSDKPVEIIITTSGKAMLLTKNEETAKKIIKQVTLKALKDAPGLDLCGVFVEFVWSQQGLVKAVKKLYQQFQKVHSSIPSPSMRFLQLPLLEQCKNSGFPASRLAINPEQQKVALSQISWRKQKETENSLNRLNKILSNDQQGRRFSQNVNQLEKKFEDIEWLGVIHADGNGLGKIFLNFQDYLQDKNNPREYVKQLRLFSLGLDICTEKAFIKSLDQIEQSNGAEQELPLVPLVLGGDDLTVICEGKSALQFTHSFLRNFEDETSQAQKIGEQEIKVVQELAKKVFAGVAHLSACAGVAIIKPHFPFSVAYELAENLLKEAKKTKTMVTQQVQGSEQPYPCSALDFHILYDSSDVQIKLMREKLEIAPTRLHNRPYVITTLEQIEGANGYEWAEFHHWDKLVDKVRVIKAADPEGKKKLPSSQTHELKTALFLGKDVADARYKLICDRYKAEGIQILAGSQESVFQEEPNPQASQTNYTTGLLDALDAADFLELQEESERNG